MYNRAPFESRMQQTTFSLFLNIFLAVVIFYNAELGRFLGTPGAALPISVVWPATGFSLAALLLFGFNTWPGIFFGNFFYNTIYLCIGVSSHSAFVSFLAALVITLRSLFQALLGATIMQRFSTSGYFATAKDVIVFLFPAGLLSCLVASTVGTLTLYAYDGMSIKMAISTWLTFWFGDTMGVYIFTPLLVVWSLGPSSESIRKNSWQIFSILVLFFLISYLSFIWSYPLTFFYIPLAIWAAFRFRMHGATLAVFVISLTAIIPTSLGHGVFVTQFLGNHLLYLVVFLEVVVATSLLLAAVINEREAATHVIESRNISLQQAVEIHREELKEMSETMYIKDKIANLGLLTVGVAKQLPKPIHKISEFTKNCLHTLRMHKGILNVQKDKLHIEQVKLLDDSCASLEADLVNIVKYDRRAQKIAAIIQELTTLTTSHKIKAKTIHVNTLVNVCLIQAMNEEVKQLPGFSYTVTKEFDKATTKLLLMPEDFAHVLIHLFKHAIFSMKEKKDRLGDSYVPVLEVSTRNHKESVEIIIKDNGNGVTADGLQQYSYSFLDEKLTEKVPIGAIDYTLCLIHDIVVHVHHGQLDVQSKEGEYLQVNILVPKS